MTPINLADTPASRAPVGKQSNLSNPHSDGNILLVVGTILLTLMLYFASMKYYVKLSVRRKFTPNDWTTIVAILWTCAYYVVCVQSMTVAKYGTHMWDLSLLHLSSESFIRIGFYAAWMPAFAWAFAKTTFFLMYLDLFSPFRWLRWACYIGLFANWSLYMSKFISNVIFMAPAPGHSWLESSLILDLYILALPIIVLWNLRVQKSKKIGVIAVFATGFLACIASTLSLIFNYVIKQKADDYTYWVYLTLLTALAEMCIGIICSCMPSLAGFFKSNLNKKLWTWGSRLLSTWKRSSPSNSMNGSNIPKIDGARIRADTYINIETEVNSTHELTQMYGV